MRALVLGFTFLAIGLFACGPGDRPDQACSAGQMHCDGLVLQTCVGGVFTDSQTCGGACSDTLGCTLCQPGTGTCNGNMAHECNNDGTDYVDELCDPAEGMTCDPQAGGCSGACAAKNLGTSYIGCEYYPTVTGNMVSDEYHFAVAVANASNDVATVTVEDGALTAPDVFMVPPMSVKVEILPWQAGLKLCMGPSWEDCSTTEVLGAFAPKGAYHLRSTTPVTVYQFNSLEYMLPTASEPSYTNDASLLLPTNTWRSQYYAAAWQPTSTSPSELAVVAREDGTTVMINSKASTTDAGGAPAFTQGLPQPVMLQRGDVIELASATGDFTGSFIQSDKPVSVIGAHYCADVPDGFAACDHLEESMFAVDTLGTHYVVNAPAVTSIPTGKVEVIRVIATSANTTLTYDPPQAGAPTALANAGDFIEISNNAESFAITATAKVLVAQYMEGQDAGGNTGDPGMTLAVPVEQFRTSYLFHAPLTYESNYVDVTAPMGATITLDGAPIAFTAIGTTGYGLARVYPLTAGPGNDGNHSMQGDMPFGISVYGYGQYTSYWYPGGLNLNDVIN